MAGNAESTYAPLDLIAEILAEGIWRLKKKEAARRCVVKRRKPSPTTENPLEVSSHRSPVRAVEPTEKGDGK